MKKILAHIIKYSIFIYIFLLPNITLGEIIDGPANVREKPRGKVIISLDDSVSVDCGTLQGKWYKVSFNVRLKKKAFIDEFRIKKNTILYDSEGKKIGKTIRDVKTPDRYSEKEGYCYALITAYIYKSNIKRDTDKEEIESIFHLTKEKITLEQLQGEWLNKKYIEKLQSTKLPCEAVKDIYITSFVISKKRASYEWMKNASHEWLIILNFHEGITFPLSGLKPTSDPNTYSVVGNHRFVISKKTINEIRWIGRLSGAGNFDIPFIRVRPNIESYVNKIVLAGTYEDQQGRTFIFNELGEAKWPDKSFNYKVELDYVEKTYRSCFEVIGEKDEYGWPMRYDFDWQDNKLHIFNTRYPSREEEIEQKPLFILTPY